MMSKSVAKTMETLRALAEIEDLAGEYAAARMQVLRIADEIAEQCREIRARHADDLRGTALAAAVLRGDLTEAIEGHGELFEKPRTREKDGERYGLRKLKGRIEIGDEEKTIKWIRVREEVDRNAVTDLSAADLKRLGIAIEADSYVVVTRPIDSDVDKLVEALLAESEQEAA